MEKRDIVLEGRLVTLEEVQPKYFEKIIEWRNNPEFNKFLNQPYKLTLELQKKWYAEKYLRDNQQGLFIGIDKKNNKPFATIGYTDYNRNENICVIGRLLVGELTHRGSKEWQEAILLFNDYIYNHMNVETVYAHIIKENIASIKWHEKWGYLENTKHIYFPNELEFNGMQQKEYFRTKAMYYEYINRSQLEKK